MAIFDSGIFDDGIFDVESPTVEVTFDFDIEYNILGGGYPWNRKRERLGRL